MSGGAEIGASVKPADQHERVLHDAAYALRLDTSRQSLEECIAAIVGLVA